MYMPKISIDYSNTVFYKIYCKDINFHDVYIGHTTNFVQRKHSHKRACNKSSHPSHNFKVYKIIREHGGWENWNMEIIGFKNCKDHLDACTVEQEYFDSYEASLNSILAKKPIVERLPVAKEKLNLYCQVCKINCSCKKSFEIHKKTKKHESALKAQNISETPTSQQNQHVKYHCEECNYKCSKNSDYLKHCSTLRHKNRTKTSRNESENSSSFWCEECNYKCSKYSNYVRHCSTLKHKNRTHRTTGGFSLSDSANRHNNNSMKCVCGKEYRARNSLWYHQKKCTKYNEAVTNTDIEGESKNSTNDSIMLQLLQEQKALREENKEMREVIQQQQEQHNKQIQEIVVRIQQATAINN